MPDTQIHLWRTKGKERAPLYRRTRSGRRIVGRESTSYLLFQLKEAGESVCWDGIVAVSVWQASLHEPDLHKMESTKTAFPITLVDFLLLLLLRRFFFTQTPDNIQRRGLNKWITIQWKSQLIKIRPAVYFWPTICNRNCLTKGKSYWLN